jgi:hypothetical protein
MTCRAVACTATSCGAGMVCCTPGGGGGGLDACHIGVRCAAGLQLCTTAMANLCPADMPVCRTNNGNNGNNAIMACRAPLPDAGPEAGGAQDGAPDTGTELDAGARVDAED